MQDGMLIHIPMSRKPININIHNMAKSEVYNIDCIEYMRTLPDNHFDLAVCDPPYGHGNDESLLGGGRRFGQRFQRYFIQPLRGMVPPLLPASGTGSKGDGGNDTTSQRTHRFSDGTWAERYKIGGGQSRSPTMGRCTTTRVL